MDRKIFTVQSHADLERCFPVIKELRPHLSFEDYVRIYEQAHKHDAYQLVAIEDGKNILAVMGYRFLWDFVRGKHLYIDDLVSTERFRSQGLGAVLLKYAESIASQSDCKALRLSAVFENTHALRFYDRNGWSKRTYGLVKKVPLR